MAHIIIELEKKVPDFSGIISGEIVSLKDLKKFVKIFINSNAFTDEEIIRISDDNKYEELAKLIIINNGKQEIIRENIIYIKMENSILGNKKAAVVDRNDLVRYVGADISAIERTVMVLVSACGCEASDQW